ncbi:MAG: hypothetical protein R3B47_17120 [Bacteroidia bacterium]
MNNQETIAAYLAGALDLFEKGEVERRMQEDEAFASEINDAREKLLMAKAVERAALKAELSEAFAQRSPSRTGARVRPLWVAGAALAAAAAALLLILFRPVASQENEMQKMALAYLEPYPLPTQRGDDTVAELRARAYEQYRKGDFVAAERSFHDLREEDFSVAIFYADCLSQNGKYPEAIEVLSHLTQGSPRADAAQWRLALNLILNGQKDSAKPWLSEIAKTDHYKAKEAQELLQKLENER